MRAINVTRGTTVAAQGHHATGFLERSRGLLGRKSMRPEEGLLIDPCSGIHMFFMAFPIDAVFVSKDGTVVHLVEGIKPWRISRYVFSARAVLELPVGSIAKSATRVGDRLVFED